MSPARPEKAPPSAMFKLCAPRSRTPRRPGTAGQKVYLTRQSASIGVVGECHRVGASGGEGRVLRNQSRNGGGGGCADALRPAEVVDDVVQGGPPLRL